jgi:hypothetical protein
MSVADFLCPGPSTAGSCGGCRGWNRPPTAKSATTFWPPRCGPSTCSAASSPSSGRRISTRVRTAGCASPCIAARPIPMSFTTRPRMHGCTMPAPQRGGRRMTEVRAPCRRSGPRRPRRAWGGMRLGHGGGGGAGRACPRKPRSSGRACAGAPLRRARLQHGQGPFAQCGICAMAALSDRLPFPTTPSPKGRWPGP